MVYIFNIPLICHSAGTGDNSKTVIILRPMVGGITLDLSFSLRDYQKGLVDFIAKSLRTNYGAALESPTGSGKTLIGLLGAIELLKGQGKKILYLTRTNSQQDQVLKELRRLSGDIRIQAVPLQGRTNLCILHKEIEDSDTFSAESLSRFCSYRKKKVMQGDQDACRYYNPRIREPDIQKYILEGLPTAEEFYSYAENRGICPYESLKYAIKRADVVITPYSSFITPMMAERLLFNWGIAREDLVIILDEAHNLPFIAREVSSFEISVHQVNLAEKEAFEAGDSELAEHIRATDFTEMIRNAIMAMMRDMLGDSEEIRVRFEEFRDYIMIQNHISSEKFKSLASYLEYLGEYIAETKEKNGKVPRSHVLSLAWNLLRWEASGSDSYVSILSRQKEGSLYALSLDPSEMLEYLKSSRTIHMSGTLQPVDVYKNLTGFTEMPHRIVRNMFPEENRLIIYNDDITTKFTEFDEEEAARMRDLIDRIISGAARNTIVFFPSYNSMETVCSGDFSFQYLKEKRDIDQLELQSIFRDFRNGGKPLFAVSGGRISEGVNFPGIELEMVIIAGIPYPRPDARQKSIQEYYEFRFHRGWDYAVTFPTAVKIRQEIGRLIRDQSDVGMAIILDRRAAYFQKYIPEMKLSKDPVRDAVDFFSKNNAEMKL